MSWESLMIDFAPYIFVVVGLVIAYSLYKIFSDNDLRIFLLLNAIIQFIVAGSTQNAISVVIAIISLLPLIFIRKNNGEQSDE